MSKSEDKIFAELFLDLKGRKKKRLDWISIAEKCQTLVDRYSSPGSVAEKLGVSPSLFRAILSLNKLPSEVRDLVRRRELLFDSAYRLNAIKNPSKQVEVARLIVNMSNKRQREVILHARRYPDSDLEDFRNRAKGDKTEKEKLRLLIIPIREELYQSLFKRSRSMHKSLDEIFPTMIQNWLKRNGGRR